MCYVKLTAPLRYFFVCVCLLRFVGDKQRMNVALTRARHALYVFGHMEALKVVLLFFFFLSFRHKSFFNSFFVMHKMHLSV